MKKKTRKFLCLILALIMVSALVGCGGSEQPVDVLEGGEEGSTYEFNMSVHDPATTSLGKALGQWADDISNATDGRVKITVFYGGTMGAPKDEMNNVETGTVDIAWNANAHNPGRFPLTDAFSLPALNMYSSVAGTKALQEVFYEFPEMQNEFDSVHLVAAHMNGIVPLATANKKINSLLDFKGLRVRSIIPNVIGLLEEIGATPISFSITESYENISKNVADGLTNDWQNLEGFKLYEVCDFVMEGSFGTPVGFVIMNNDSYNSMPEDLKNIFDETSADLPMKLAAAFDDGAENSKKVLLDNGVEIYPAPADVQTAIISAGEKISTNWVAVTSTSTFDAQLLLDKVRASLDKYE